MLFKLFTLFSVFVLTQSASIQESKPSHVTRHHHHHNWGGNGGSGCGGGNGGGWQELLSGQTVTVTVTETPVYSTSTDEPTVIDEPTVTDEFTTDSSTNSGGDSTDLNSQEHCLYLFNEMRKSQNLPLFESATQEQIDCADKAAAYDAQAGYHASFYNNLCGGTNNGGTVPGDSPASQCECQKNVGLYDLPNADPNDPLKNCINAYIAEYTLGFYPSEGLGHWKIITNPSFKYLACGTDNNGFYTHNFYT